jgi:hypothetical protein
LLIIVNEEQLKINDGALIVGQHLGVIHKLQDEDSIEAHHARDVVSVAEQIEDTRRIKI